MGMPRGTHNQVRAFVNSNKTDTLPSGPVKFAGLNSEQRESGPREIRIRE
jgi:hypothetical protein